MSSTSKEFSVADYAVFLISLAASVGIGVYQWWRQRSADSQHYFTGGGEMPPICSSISLLVGMISAISILGNSAEMYYRGTQLWVNCFGVIIGGILVAITIVPVLYPLKLTSMYMYFELRWHTRFLKEFITLSQIINMILYSGICLYAPSLALSAVTDLDIRLSIWLQAIVCTLTSTLGGAKAVVYADTFQSFFMVGGIIAVIIEGCVEMGGVENVWRVNDYHGRINSWNFDPNPLLRNTFWTCTFLGIYNSLNALGTNQGCFQRWGSVKSLKQSYFIIYSNIFGLIATWSLINLAGLVIFAVYADCDPLTQGLISKTDQISVYFVVDKLAYLPGIPGLFVAAVFSGVLSSCSTQINSIAALTWVDFLVKWKYFAEASVSKKKITIKIISACAGILGAILGMVCGSFGSLIMVTYSINGAFGGPIGGLLLTAICCPWVNGKSGVIGFGCGLLICIWQVVGAFKYAPRSPLLPLSTEGCPIANLTGYTTEDLITPTMHMASVESGEDVSGFYKLSYCYVGIMGVLITMIMANIASLFIGPIKPENVPAKLVNQRCLAFHQWMHSLKEKTPREMSSFPPMAAFSERENT